jgi:hypothetical protein
LRWFAAVWEQLDGKGRGAAWTHEAIQSVRKRNMQVVRRIQLGELWSAHNLVQVADLGLSLGRACKRSQLFFLSKYKTLNDGHDVKIKSDF